MKIRKKFRTDFFEGVFALLAVCSPVFGKDLYDTDILRTIDLEFAQSGWWQQLTSNYQSGENILATLTVGDAVYDSVGVRFRGNTSYQMVNGEKKSFNIEIDWKKDQNLMGYESLNLNNSYDDPTFMREVLYSNTCREVLPSAKANFVRLEINGENWGVYASVQQIDGTFIREWFASNDGTRWRGDKMTMGGGMGGRGGGQMGGGGTATAESALNWLGADSSKYADVYTLKKTGQENPWESLINTCDVLNNTALDALHAALETVLNVDRALWLCAFEIVFHDDDGYVSKRGADYMLYYEPESGRIHLVQYDANTSMKMSNNNEWPLCYREDDSGVPIMYRLMKIPRYRQRYLAHVRTLLEDYLTEDFLFPLIESYQTLIYGQVQLDTKKLYSNTQFTSGIAELKTFIQNRRNYLINLAEIDVPAPSIQSIDRIVNDSESGQSLTLSARLDDTVPVAEVNLFLAVGACSPFTSFAMLDDGQHQDGAAGDGVYGIDLPACPRGTVLRYYVQAIASDAAGTMAFEPAAEHMACEYVVSYPVAGFTPVVINELMASNAATITDPQGEYDDWIELMNLSDSTVDLSGMYLSDNPENPLKWPFPDGTQIVSKGYLLVWADEDGSDEGLHASFKLSAEGEMILLFDTEERGHALLDSVRYSAQETDVSSGRYPDAEGKVTHLFEPTPLTQNSEPAQVKNEDALPDAFQLYPNYPNPFNPTTTIPFDMAQDGLVTMKVYNVAGEEIATLLDGPMRAGSYRVTWNASGFSGGIYIVCLEAEGFSSTRKLLFVK